MGDPTPTEVIQVLARKCATSGLRYRDAVALFNSLYRADALAMARGNKTLAAQRAGVNRVNLVRARTRDEKVNAEMDGANG